MTKLENLYWAVNLHLATSCGYPEGDKLIEFQL